MAWWGGWVGWVGWVGGLVGWIKREETVRMRLLYCCGWVGGWVGVFYLCEGVSLLL